MSTLWMQQGCISNRGRKHFQCRPSDLWFLKRAPWTIGKGSGIPPSKLKPTPIKGLLLISCSNYLGHLNQIVKSNRACFVGEKFRDKKLHSSDKMLPYTH